MDRRSDADGGDEPVTGEWAITDAAFQALSDVFYLFDERGRFLRWNDQLPAVTGYTDEELAAMEPTDFFAGEDTERVAAAVERIVTGDGPVTVEATVVTKSGETIPYEFSGALASGGDGSPAEIVGIGRDITERRERERELERREAYLEHSSDILTVVDETGTVRYESGSVEDVTGFGADEIRGESGFDFVHPDDRERVRELLGETVANPDEVRRVEFRAETRDGSWRWLESRGVNLLDDPVVDGIVISTRDVTARKQRERELRGVRREYEQVFQNTKDAIFLVDVVDDGFRLSRINSSEEELTGFSNAEIRGKRPRDVLSEEDAEHVVSKYRECVERREPITYEEVLSLPAGTRVWQTRVTPVVRDGEVTQLVGVARDITRLKTYQEQLEDQRDRLALLNRVVRHDIRNDMNVALGWGAELESHVDEEGERMLERIQNTNQHVVDLTRTLREVIEALGSDERPELAPTDLGQTLEEEIATRQSSYPGASFTVEGTVPSVQVQANELLSSVFRNVLNNAVQHNDADEPRVVVRVDERDEAATVRVADNGPGVPPSRRDAIFGRTDRGLDDPATGIGLYLVDTLVGQYDGRVEVGESDLGGAVFEITLPKAE